MSRYDTLAKRIAKVEQAASRSRRRLPRLAFTIYDQDAACIGFAGSSGAIVKRQAGEPMKALLRRSEAILDDTSIWAVYPPDDAPEPIRGQNDPVPEHDPTSDPVSLAGVGRRATEAELSGMAMLATPTDW